MSTKIFFRFSVALFGGIFLVQTIVNSGQAQPLTFEPVPGAADPSDLSSNFYKDPRPERLKGWLQSLKGSPIGWQAYPPTVGLLSIVFAKHPEWIEPLMAGERDAMSASTLAAALRLAGRPERENQLRWDLRNSSFDPILEAEFNGLPARLEDIRIATPTHLDILWGASFASGDGRYARQIIAFFANTANRSGPLALDITQVAVHMAGAPNDVISSLKGKYGESGAYQVIYSATALWGVQSNARQHDFVKQEVETYIRDNPVTFATMAFSVFRPGWQNHAPR